MLCRHNRHVQDFGRTRDPDEIARREQAWERGIEAVEAATGRQAAALPPDEFRREMGARIDLRTFEQKRPGSRRKR
jgi:hypothetical protein